MSTPVLIPTLQLDSLAAGSTAQLAQACRTTGFFHLSLPDAAPLLAQIAQAFEQSEAFFALPLSLKLQIERSPQTNCGYVPLGAEALNPNRPGDCKEALNLGGANLGETCPWPAELRPFQQALAPVYHACIQQLAFPVLRALALSLDLPDAFFIERHQQNFVLRLLHYPPLAAPEPQLAAGEHTDYGTLTLLFQAGQAGLEIARDGDWLPVAASPELILVNLGDALQRWTNDRYRSTPHRVVRSQPVSRYSMALFCDPDPAVEIASLPTCGTARRYRPIRYQDYLHSRFRATYEPSAERPAQ